MPLENIWRKIAAFLWASTKTMISNVLQLVILICILTIEIHMGIRLPNFVGFEVYKEYYIYKASVLMWILVEIWSMSALWN